jgi:hypothetical protein
VLLALALAAYAAAARQDATVASYTGCLKNGKIESVAVGDTPLAPCGGGQTQLRLSGGDITSVSAGSGLTGGGVNGELTLAVDPAAVQTRVGENCLRLDASISAIHQDGTVICNPDDTGPDVFAGFADGPVPLPPAFPPPSIAQLAQPVGNYAIIATLDVAAAAGNDFGIAGSCELHAGADFDRTRFVTSYSSRLALQVVHEFTDPGDAVVSCNSIGAGEWSFLKITATRVANLSNGPLTLP